MNQKFDVFAFNKALADGPYAWPGGYPLYFLASDGEAISFAAAEQNAPLIRDAIIAKSRDGWRVVGVCVNWEDGFLFCAHTGEQIQCAYGDE